MKKFAMMLLNPLFEPEEHMALFLTGNIENYIFTVRNEKEALDKTKDLVKQGFGVLELCGAFDEKLVQEIYAASEGKLCIGHVVYPPEQEEALQEYWESQ
jgi:hypothetical protein